MPHQLFVVIDRFRRRFTKVVVALEPLTSAPERPRPSSCRGYFRDDTGVALIQLNYSHLTAAQLKWAGRVCKSAGVAVLNPALLETADQARFYIKYLDGYRVCADGEPTAEDALLAIGRELSLVAAVGRERRARGSGAEETLPRSRRPDTMPLGSPMSTVKATPATGTAALNDRIEVRYQRGDDWTPGRLRSLNTKSIFVAASAPPRLGDQARIDLSFQRIRVVVDGVVTQVTSAADAGTTGFRTNLEQLEPEPKRQLVALLRSAHAAGVSLSPPPPRAAVRLPVRWPIRVTTPEGHRTVPALDISASGLFLGADQGRFDPELMFLLPMDNGESPIRGRARIAREVDTVTARVRGLKRGYGVQITELSRIDERRYDSFLGRIRRRARHSVVVIASLERATVLADTLAAVGYAVSAGSDPEVLRQRWIREPRQPDAVIIDDSVGRHRRAAGELEAMWKARGVVCVHTSASTSPNEARTSLDRQLRVGRKTSGVHPIST